MANLGNSFSIDDILSLGNPADQQGVTLAAALRKHHHFFPTEELKRLIDPDEVVVARQVALGETPPLEILLSRPDLLVRYGAV